MRRPISAVVWSTVVAESSPSASSPPNARTQPGQLPVAGAPGLGRAEEGQREQPDDEDLLPPAGPRPGRAPGSRRRTAGARRGSARRAAGRWYDGQRRRGRGSRARAIHSTQPKTSAMPSATTPTTKRLGRATGRCRRSRRAAPIGRPASNGFHDRPRETLGRGASISPRILPCPERRDLTPPIMIPHGSGRTLPRHCTKLAADPSHLDRHRDPRLRGEHGAVQEVPGQGAPRRRPGRPDDRRRDPGPGLGVPRAELRQVRRHADGVVRNAIKTSKHGPQPRARRPTGSRPARSATSGSSRSRPRVRARRTPSG